MSTKRFSIRINGFLTTKASVTVSYPDPNNLRVPLSNEWIAGYFPPQTNGFDMVTVEGVKFMGNNPMIQGSAIRGALRGIAHSIAAGNIPLSFRDLNMNLMGGQNPTKNFPVTEAQAIRSNNPLMGLFGGCDPTFIGGCLKIGDAVATGQGRLAVIDIIRRDAVDRNPNLLNQLSDPNERIAYVAFAREASKLKSAAKSAEWKKLRELGAADPKVRSDARNQIKKQYESDLADLLAKYDNRFSSQDVRQLHRVFAIPHDVRLTHSMKLVEATEFEVGLFLKALRKFQAFPFIGGRGASGAGGDFDLDYKIEVWDDEAGQFNEGGSLENLSPELLACIQAFNAAKAAEEFQFSYDRSAGDDEDSEAPETAEIVMKTVSPRKRKGLVEA